MGGSVANAREIEMRMEMRFRRKFLIVEIWNFRSNIELLHVHGAPMLHDSKMTNRIRTLSYFLLERGGNTRVP